MKVYTTGQVAKICKVAPRTVSKWFDSGQLRGYRIPGSQDRRIPHEYLVKFLKEYGMPLDGLEDESKIRVLVVSQDESLLRDLTYLMDVDGSFKLKLVHNAWEAGYSSEDLNPDCIIVDFAIGKEECLNLCNSIINRFGFSNTLVFAVVPETITTTFDRSSITEVFKQPIDKKELIQRVRFLAGQRKKLTA